ncbi:MAG: hypothetical protein ACKPKO_26390, partial [Candidatus Fonsibacter sp.]
EASHVHLQVGSFDTTHAHELYRLVWPWQGFHFFWDAATLYTTFRLRTVCGGKRATWVYRQRKGWARLLLESLGSSMHFAPGAHFREADAAGTGKGQAEFQLPTAALSTAILFLVLLRMATARSTQQLGRRG